MCTRNGIGNGASQETVNDEEIGDSHIPTFSSPFPSIFHNRLKQLARGLKSDIPLPFSHLFP